GNVIQNPALAWRTPDPTVVRLDTTTGPLAIAVGAGTARVIATSGTVADTCLVTVTNAPVFLDITRVGDTLTSLGDSFPVPIVMLNARGDTLAPSSAQWSSDVPLVAPVTGAGVVIARDTGGTVVRAKAARAGRRRGGYGDGRGGESDPRGRGQHHGGWTALRDPQAPVCQDPGWRQRSRRGRYRPRSQGRGSVFRNCGAHPARHAAGR